MLVARPDPPKLPPKLYTSFNGSVYVDVDDQRVRQKLAAAQPLVFEPMHDAYLAQSHNEIDFYTWQDERLLSAQGRDAGHRSRRCRGACC